MQKPNLNKIMADNLEKAKFQSKKQPTLPGKFNNGGIYLSDRAQATQFGQYGKGGSSWMLTNPNKISTFFPRMENGGPKPKYEQWIKTVNPDFISNDYNLRDAYNELPYKVTKAWAKDPERNHLPDTYKLPNHPTFSNESKYYDSVTPGVGGYWGEGEENFIKNPKIGPPIPSAKWMGQYKRGGGMFPEYHSWAPPMMKDGGPGDGIVEFFKNLFTRKGGKSCGPLGCPPNVGGPGNIENGHKGLGIGKFLSGMGEGVCQGATCSPSRSSFLTDSAANTETGKKGYDLGYGLGHYAEIAANMFNPFNATRSSNMSFCPSGSYYNSDLGTCIPYDEDYKNGGQQGPGDNYSKNKEQVVNQLSNLPIYSPDQRYSEYQQNIHDWIPNVMNTPVQVNYNSPAQGSSYYGHGAPFYDPSFPYQGTIQLDDRQFNNIQTPDRVIGHELRHAAFDGSRFIPKWYGDNLYNTARNPKEFEQGAHQNKLRERASMLIGARQNALDQLGLPANAKLTDDQFNYWARQPLETSLRTGRIPEQYNDVKETFEGARNASDVKNLINFEKIQRTTPFYKDAIASKKNGGDISIPDLQEGNWLSKYPGGGVTVQTTTNPNVEIQKGKTFNEQWMNSPMYKKMLAQSTGQPISPFLPDINEIDKQRKNELANSTWGMVDQAKEKNGELETSAAWSQSYTPWHYPMAGRPTTIENYDGYYPTEYYKPYVGFVKQVAGKAGDELSSDAAHEFSHSSDKGGMLIPVKDLALMKKYASSNYLKSPLFQQDKSRYSNFSDLTSDKDHIERQQKWLNYVNDPTETRARLTNFRQRAKEQGIYDPFTQPFDIKYLDKYKQIDNKGWDPINQLRDSYSDQEISDMLNKISKSDNGQPQTTAKYGGASTSWLTKYPTGGVTAQTTKAPFVFPSYTMPLNRTDAPGGMSIQEKQKQNAIAEEIHRRNVATNKRQFVEQGKASTPASEAKRTMLNKQYASQQPNAQIDEQGNVSTINPNMTAEGQPSNFMGERQQKSVDHIVGALEAAGYLTGTGELAGAGYNAAKKALAESMESGLLSNTYKYNPWAFKPNPESAYRMIGGKEGYLDAINSGEIRAMENGVYGDAHFNMGLPLNPNRLSSEELLKAGSPGGYKGPYMVERRWADNAWNKHAMTDGFKDNPEILQALKDLGKDKDVWGKYGNLKTDDIAVKLYKEHWLKGYKEVPKSTPLTGTSKQSSLFGNSEMFTNPKQYFTKPSGGPTYTPNYENISRAASEGYDPFAETLSFGTSTPAPRILDWRKIGQTAAGVGIGSGLVSGALKQKKEGGDTSTENLLVDYYNKLMNKYGPGGETTDGCPAGFYKHSMLGCVPIPGFTPNESKQQAQIKTSKTPIFKGKGYGQKVDPYERIIAKDTEAKQAERNKDLAKRAAISAGIAGAIVTGGAAAPYVLPALEAPIAGVAGLTGNNLLVGAGGYNLANNINNGTIANRFKNAKDWKDYAAATGETAFDVIGGIPMVGAAVTEAPVLFNEMKNVVRGIAQPGGITSPLAHKLYDLSKTIKAGEWKDHLMGVAKGINEMGGYQPKSFSEVFPLTKAQKLKIMQQQDEAAAQGENFVKNWFYGEGNTLRPEVEERITNIHPKLKGWRNNNLDLDSEGNPIANVQTRLTSSRINELFDNSNLSNEAKGYITRNRGSIGGVNMDGTPESITLRNHGFYYNDPQRIKDVSAHELTHSAQNLGFNHPSNGPDDPGSWLDVIQSKTPDNLYFEANPKTDLGKKFKEAMVEAVPGKFTWEASPGELHSETMVGRQKFYEDLIKHRNYTPERAMKLLQNPRESDLDMIMEYGNLNRFFKPGTSDKVKRELLRLLPATIPAVAGAAALKQKKRGGSVLEDYYNSKLPKANGGTEVKQPSPIKPGTLSTVIKEMMAAEQAPEQPIVDDQPVAQPIGPENQYMGHSIVDYLATKGYPGTKTFRKQLAKQYNVENYDFSGSKNIELLNKLRQNDDMLEENESTVTPVSVDKMMQMEKEASIPKAVPQMIQQPRQNVVPVVKKKPVRQVRDTEEVEEVTTPINTNPFGGFSNPAGRGKVLANFRTPSPAQSFNTQAWANNPLNSTSFVNNYKATAPVVKKQQPIVKKQQPSKIGTQSFNENAWAKNPINPLSIVPAFKKVNKQTEVEESDPIKKKQKPISNDIEMSDVLGMFTGNPSLAIKLSDKLANNETFQDAKSIFEERGISGLWDAYQNKSVRDKGLAKGDDSTAITNFTIPVVNPNVKDSLPPPVVFGKQVVDTDREDPNFYHAPMYVDLNRAKFGFKNRGGKPSTEQNGITETAGLVLTPFAAEYSSKSKRRNSASDDFLGTNTIRKYKDNEIKDNVIYGGIDDNGTFQLGYGKDMKGKNLTMSDFRSVETEGFIKDAKGNYKLGTETSNKKTSKVPHVKTDKGETYLPFLVPNAGKDQDKTYGQNTGGKIVIATPDFKEKILVGGSLSDVDKALEEFKAKHKLSKVKLIVLDNGTYSRGFMKKGNKISSADWKKYEVNSSGGAGFYLKGQGYKMGGSVTIGDEMDVTDEELEQLKKQGYKFDII